MLIPEAVARLYSHQTYIRAHTLPQRLCSNTETMAPNEGFSTSRWRRNRSNVNLSDQTQQATPSPPRVQSNSLKPAPKLDRSTSRMSLFNLFSKPKVERARGHTEAGLAVPMPPPEPPKPAPPLPPKSALRFNPPPQQQQAQRMRSSQILRPTSMRPTSIRRPPSDGDDWDLPPLFQVYPQSIKYATVQACVYSTDALLRSQSQRIAAEHIRERIDSHTALQEGSEHKKLEKSHRRLESMLNTAPQLTTKIYVLVTAGYILQYSEYGPNDRLPERVLKLGKDSAAFASDLIPGKHWVLQIVQSANEDGSVAAAPKNSLLSRLRSQGPTRRATASFLLVLDSAEEMESWMTIVRKQIENFGGMKASSESSRASASFDDSSDKVISEHPYQRQPVKRESSRLSMLTPIDSPFQSQCSDSPKIVASEWEGDHREKRLSVHSSRRGDRQSVDAPSIATTTVSHDQLQLDQLRERSRHSYVSSATSVSAGTRNNSRDPSPASTSPIREVHPSPDAEPRRSATTLRSFHMNPGNSSTRRRSMQPLPVTNEDTSAAANDQTPKRHSIYGPTSPTAPELSKEPAKAQYDVPRSFLLSGSATTTQAPPTNNARISTTGQPRDAYPARFSMRSSSAPPSRHTITVPPPVTSLPPQAPLPELPTSRPQSTVVGSISASASTLPAPRERRVSATPKPFLRPLPVRPQTQAPDGSNMVSRRSTMNKPPPLPLGIIVNRSVTAPARPPSGTANTTQQQRQSNALPTAQSLRRPSTVQIRSDPAPFLSSSRPARAVSSTPSFIQGQRASMAPGSTIRQTPSNPALRGYGQQLAPVKDLAPRRSMPVIGLPPPAPPPNMPLPPPPPVAV